MNQDVHDGRWPSALGTPKTVRSRGAVRWVIAGLAVVAGAALAGGIPAEAAPVTVRAGATPTYSTARAPALSIASSQAPVPVREVREYTWSGADNYANAEAVIDGKLLPGDPGYIQACLASVQGTSRDPEQGTRISRQMGAALDATGNSCRNLRGRPPGPVWRSSLCTSVPRRCGHTSAGGNLHLYQRLLRAGLGSKPTCARFPRTARWLACGIWRSSMSAAPGWNMCSPIPATLALTATSTPRSSSARKHGLSNQDHRNI